MKYPIFLLVICGFIVTGCGKSGNSGTRITNVTTTPDAAQLSAPAQSAICISGAIVSDSLSTVTFNWAAAQHTDSYILYIKNLLSGLSTNMNTSDTQLAVTLSRNTPYSWYVISKSNTDTVHSDTWKFYNSGPGVTDYAPYPAELISPASGSEITATGGAITLLWTGSSANPGDALTFDIYLGKNSTPELIQSAVSASTLKGINVTSGNSYYWKIITRDAAGNTSDSGVQQFSVN